MSVKLTTAYWKIKHLRRKIRIVQGGQGASKTYSILTLLFELAWNSPNTRITVVTETFPQLRDGVISDMQQIVTDTGLQWGGLFNITNKNLYLPNYSLIQFRNIDNKDFHRAKGARRDYLFVNEANRTMWGSIEQMWTRTSKGIYVDYNPDREFWVHDQFLKGDDADVDFLILTYTDNECLPEGEVKEIEKRRGNALWWRIYGEGQLGVYSERQIYSYEFIDAIPADAKRIFSGMDFGLSPDPTTLVDMYVKDADLYCDEIFTANNLMAEKIAGAERMSVVDKMDEVNYPKGWPIVADSASKNSITDMRRHGYHVYGADKYQGSVVDGIKVVKSYDLKITRRSEGIKKGCEAWFFKVDDNGKIIPEPEGHEPDQLAAIRYGLTKWRKNSGGFTV